MSTLDETIAVAQLVEEPRSAPGWWSWIDRIATAANQRLNPILVKEARQALKSRQFTITFTLVLAAAWGWTMLGVAMVGPEIYYGASGSTLLAGYYVVLSAALVVIVPFSSFWSLATERADGTYELLSITTLTPRHVITGKLASSILQMLVYYSALAPCLAFTYLLRGVDVALIGMVLFYMFHASLGLSAIGLLVATATSERHWQVVLSVFMVAGLIGAFITSLFFLEWIVYSNGVAFSEPYFWVQHLTVLSVFWGYFALVVQSASSQLDFPSNNRSTRLRVVMLFQQLLFFGWMAYGLMLEKERNFLIFLLTFSGVHWAVMGAFMVGEAGELSQRARRMLPRSFLGRAFFTWFNPGSGAGYIFTLASFTALVMTVVGGELLWRYWASLSYGQSLRSGIRAFDSLTFGLTMLFYLTIYLGLTRSIVLLLRRAGWGTMFMSLLVCALLLMLGCGVPLSIHMMAPVWRGTYSLLEVSNPFWTLSEMTGDTFPVTEQIPVFRYFGIHGQLQILVLLGIPAALVMLLNLPSIAREVQQVRAASPKRVLEEAAAKLPASAPERKNPWDDGAPVTPNY